MTGRRAIFHLGSYKTGSSSLQNLLHDNHDRLRAAGVLYPKSVIAGPRDIGLRHSRLVYGFLGGDPVLPDALRDEIERSGCATVIFSSEAWSKPVYLKHLNHFVPALEEMGFTGFDAVLCLRNLTRYQVSYYREFTVNHRNAKPYKEYVKGGARMFDYLRLVKRIRNRFGDALRVLDFETSPDIRRDILAAMGLGALWDDLEQPTNANVKKLSAVEVEAKRCANQLGLDPQAWRDAMPRILERVPGAADPDWTERFPGDTPEFPDAYQKRLSKATGLTQPQVAALLEVPPVEGRDVSALSAAILSELSPLKV